MKKTIASLLLTVAALPAFAQTDIFDNPGNRPTLGARVGIDITSTSEGYGIFSNGLGFSAGAVYNIPVFKNLYVEPGLSLFYDTFGQTEYTHLGNGAIKEINGSLRNFGFRIPLVAGYFFDFTDDVRVAPWTGPQLNLSLIARDHIGDYDHSAFGEYGFKHIDLQWAFGVSALYQNYYIGIGGAVGLTRVHSANGIHFNRNNVTISLGYNF